MKFRRKVPKHVTHQLMQIYLHMGQEVAGPMCVERGLHCGYARGQAQSLGMFRRRKLRGGGNIAFGVDHSDPRWRWAIERGPVVA